MVNQVAVVAGDSISLECNPDSTPAITRATWTTVFEGTTANESLILGTTGGWVLSTSTPQYVQVMTATSRPAIENDVRQVCPTDGKIKNLYVELNVDPGTAPDAYRFTLRKNGINQTLVVTIIANNTTGFNVINEVDVAPGDVLTLLIEPISGPSETPACVWGMTFVADIDGESVIMSGSFASPANGVVQYNNLQCSYQETWRGIATEDERYQLGQECTLMKLYILLLNAPSAGDSYDFTVRVNGVDGNITVHIHDADTTGFDIVNTDVIANDDYVDLECLPTSSPDITDVYWGLVGYRDPGGGGITDKSAHMGSKMVGAGLI